MSDLHDDELMSGLRRGVQRLVDDQQARDLDTTLARVVAIALDVVPGAVGVGVTRTEDGQLHDEFCSDDQVQQLHRFQAHLGEGPCVEAATRPAEYGVVLALDLAGADAERWSDFAAVAVSLGFRSMLLVDLLGPRPGVRVALTLFGRTADAFDERARRAASLVALQATAVLDGAYHAEHLTRALGTRDLIGQAKGILMERFTVDDDAAFRMLVAASQDTNVKVSAVTHWLVGEAQQRSENKASVEALPGVTLSRDRREPS